MRISVIDDLLTETALEADDKLSKMTDHQIAATFLKTEIKRIQDEAKILQKQKKCFEARLLKLQGISKIKASNWLSLRIQTRAYIREKIYQLIYGPRGPFTG